jgi:hypothetical protein
MKEVLPTMSILSMLDYRFCTGPEEGMVTWSPILEKKNLGFCIA